MNKKNAKGLVSILSTVTIASIILLCLIILLVCNGVIRIKFKPTRIQKNWESTESYISADEKGIEKLIKIEEKDEAITDFRFIDKNGNYYEMDSNVEEIQSHWNCNHSWQLGTVTKHRTYTNRACENTLYSASKCPKCGDIRIHNEFELHKYAKCPH